MNDQTTIIIITHNNYELIKKVINLLKDYLNSHHNITEIIIIDNHSTDGTKEYLQSNQPNNFKIILFDNELSDKKCLIRALEESTTNNIIILEQELRTRLHQIRKVIIKLHKSDLVLTNRFHKNSKVKMISRFDEGMKNLIAKTITGVTYHDPFNVCKAFKKNKLLPIIMRTNTDKQYWLEIIKESKNNDINIIEIPTHYIQEQPRESIFLKNFKELLTIRKKKK